MVFLELFVPSGLLDVEARQRVVEEIVARLMPDDGAVPSGAIGRARSLVDGVVHEVDFVRFDGSDVPTYRARLTIPAGHISDGRRSMVVETITRVLAGIDFDPEGLVRDGRVTIEIVEVPDGNLGTFGQVVRLDGIIEWVMTGREPSTDPVAAD